MFSSTSGRRLLLSVRSAGTTTPRIFQQQRQRPVPPFVLSPRSFQTSPRPFARKDTQDKDTLKPESNEYSKSGSDAASATVEDAAFSADKTRPEEQHAEAEKETEGSGMNNPLNVSPANQEISKPKQANEGREAGSPAESKDGNSGRQASGGGSPVKRGGGSSGGGGGS